LSDHLYISSSCRISKSQVFKNEELLLEHETGSVEWPLGLYKHFAFDYPKFYRMDNLSRLGWIAAELLLEDDFHKSFLPENVGIVLANKSSSLETDIKYFESTKTIASPALFVYTLPNIVMGEISIRHHLKGENALFVSERFDGEFIQQYVQDLFRVGAVELCVCGWLEYFQNNMEASLYLVGKIRHGMALPFSDENITKIYQLTNG
jgi:hypothetical protein